MEAVKDTIECLNLHWIAMISMGMYTHIRQICIIGLCFAGESASPFSPTYASCIFTFSVLSLLAEYKPWPMSLKEPPIILLYIYEMIIAALVQNLSTRAMWIPLMNSIECLHVESSKSLLWLNLYLGMDNYSILSQAAQFLISDDSVNYMSYCMAIFSFVWMLDATESLESITELWAKLKNTSYYSRKRRSNKRISFEDPEVTHRFYYKVAQKSFSETSED